MLHQGFLTKHTNSEFKKNPSQSFVSKITLSLGVVICLSALIHMIINLAQADSFIHIWLPFMIAGVLLVFVSQVFSWRS